MARESPDIPHSMQKAYRRFERWRSLAEGDPVEEILADFPIPEQRVPETTLHDDRAENSQNDVPEGENARPEADYAIVEAEIVRHLQGRSGKIVSIKVGG
jgi:hypothetical protein